MKHLKLFFALFAMLALGVGNAGAETVFSETFGAGTTTNTAYSSFTKYSATAEMFTDGKEVKTHYSGDGKVGKNNLSGTNVSSGYDGVSGGSGCYHQGTANTQSTIISISNINIQNYSDLSLSFGALGGNTSHKVDVTYSIDNGEESSLISSGSITNKNWTLLSAQIAGTGNSLTLYFKHKPTKGWTIRLDDFKITGTLSSETPDEPTCTTITPTLTYSATSLIQGETAAATLEGNTGSGEVTYTTSDDKIATVAADGTITAVGAGTATITANIAEVGEYCDGKATATVTVTPLVSCSEIYGLADDATFVLKDFTVTYVNGKYTYIKDNTGYGLIFNNAGEYGLKAGDQVASTKLEGKKDTYNGLVEIIPTTTFANLEFTSGTAPAPEAMNVLPANADVNKYVKFEDVTFASTAFSSKKVTGKINAGNITFYDQFATNATFNTSKKYDVIGAVSVYNSTIQVNFISAEEVAEPTLNVKITDTDFGKVAINDSHERTLTLNGSLLTKPVELTIEGDYFTLASNSITPTDGSISEAKIKITYKPTAEGTHTATLKITSDELAGQTITLTGQAVQQHTVHFFVNGEEEETLAKKVLSGEKLTEIPTATSCDPLEYPTFIGWSDSEITGTTDVEPTDLLDLNTTITADCKYYAVFAKSTTTGSAEGTETITIANFKDGVDADGTQALYESTSATWEWLKNSSSSKINTTYDQIRLYASHTLTISPKAGYTITKIVAAISENKYVTPFAAGGLTGATSSADGLNITLTPTGGNIVITQAAQSRVTSFTITHTASSTENTYLTTCESATPTYTVTYDLDGGESTCETSVVVEQNGELTLCDAPTKKGHTFLKWKDQSDNEYEAGATITVSSNLTLTAQWQKESYKVTWTSLGEEVASANVEYNSQPTKPAEDPTYTCYGDKEFVGWTTKEIDGIGVPANLYTDEFPVVTEAITYYAVFAGRSAEATTTVSTLLVTEKLGNYESGSMKDDQENVWKYYAGGLQDGETYYIALRNNNGEISYIESPKFSGTVQSIVAHVKNGSASKVRTVYLRSSAIEKPTEGDLGETSIPTSNNGDVTLNITNSFDKFFIQVSDGLQFHKIVVTSGIAAGAHIDYITSCDAVTSSISIDDISLCVGDEHTITATIKPTTAASAVSYTIKENATNAISLSGNTITALAEGTATITATIANATDYAGSSIDFKVTVDAAPVTSKVVILAQHAGQWYAMKAEKFNETSLSAIPVTYVNGTLYNVADSEKEAIEWERTTRGNTATFKKGENYLIGTTTGSTDLKLGDIAFEWAVDGNLYLCDDNKRTFIFNKEGYFKNYSTKNASNGVAIDATYSSLPVVTAPVYEIGDAYGRTVTTGEYGTICIPFGSNVGDYTGAEFYEISWMEMDGATPKGIWLDQVNDALTAGKPYIFKATATELAVIGNGTTAGSPVTGVAGLTGTFTLIQDLETSDLSNTLEGNYMISGNQFLLCPAGCWLTANRAYIDATIIANHTEKKAEIPGRRRVCMGETSENEATGFENIVAPEGQAVKAIVNGQLIIIRDGVKYNVQGQKL